MIDRDFWRYQPREFWWVGVSAIAMVVGTFGPWIAAYQGSSLRTGLHGRGFVVLAGGLAALAVLAALRAERRGAHWGLALAAVAGAAGTYVSWTFIVDLDQGPKIAGIGHLIRPGWGVVASLAASLSLLAAAGYAFVRPPADWR